MILYMFVFIFILIKFSIDTLNLAVGCSPSKVNPTLNPSRKDVAQSKNISQYSFLGLDQFIVPQLMLNFALTLSNCVTHR